MKKNITFNRDVIQPGMMNQVKSYGFLGRSVRWGLIKWEKRLCKEYNLPYNEPFANHTSGFVMQKNGELGIGEALAPGGNVVSSIESYERKMSSGKIEVKVYRVVIDGVPITEHDQLYAANNWMLNIKGKPYNYGGYPRLIIKSMFFDWSDIEPTNKVTQMMKWIGDSQAGKEWADWCTEGWEKCYRDWKPNLDVFQTQNATPLTGDQVGGQCPRKPGKKITLEEVKDAIIERPVGALTQVLA